MENGNTPVSTPTVYVSLDEKKALSISAGDNFITLYGKSRHHHGSLKISCVLFINIF